MWVVFPQKWRSGMENSEGSRSQDLWEKDRCPRRIGPGSLTPWWFRPFSSTTQLVLRVHLQIPSSDERLEAETRLRSWTTASMCWYAKLAWANWIRHLSVGQQGNTQKAFRPPKIVHVAGNQWIIMDHWLHVSRLAVRSSSKHVKKLGTAGEYCWTWSNIFCTHARR